MTIFHKAEMKTLRYKVLEQTHLPSSVSVFDSDSTPNLIIMEQIVGTLVKYGNSGREEPYLAKSWEITNNNTTWTFKLNEGLSCEDGTPINSINYVNSLKRVLKKLSVKSPNLPVFSNLVGFEKFLKGNIDALGVYTPEKYTISFNFTQKVSGLLEFLSMPYYGFYSKNNFSNGQWKNNKQIISSAVYQIKSWSEDKVILKKRDDFILKNTNFKGSEFVEVSLTTAKELLSENPENTIILNRNHQKLKTSSLYSERFGIPTYLTALVLSPFKDGVFKNQKTRQTFSKVLSNYHANEKIESNLSRKTKSFYHQKDSDKIESKPLETKLIDKILNDKTISVAYASEDSDVEIIYIKEILNKIAVDFSFKIKWIKIDRKDHDWIKKYTSNDIYDLKIARVNAGSHPINWAIKMMFCSNLGISFPDPNNNICKLTEDFERTDNKLSSVKYEKVFSQILEEDSAVLPLFHSSWRWFISKNLNMDSINPTSAALRFDLIEEI